MHQNKGDTAIGIYFSVLFVAWLIGMVIYGRF